MLIRLPEEVTRIITVLQDAGHEAYAVGGCVRDSLLGRTPTDWDITTSADPSDVQRLFSRTIPTGIEHGTVTVRMRGKSFEVTTFRIDGKYSDGRHPESVTFTASLEEDLARRDFTVNAMAYAPDKGLIDLFDGRRHLEEKIICAVGDPEKRFGEDALRILRALRFSAQLSFSIEERTAAAVRKLAGTLERISAERIRTELEKLITSDHPEMLEEAYRLGVTAVVLPEFDRCMETPQNHFCHCADVGRHTILTMQAVPKDTVLRLAMLLHDIGKPACRVTDRTGTDHFPDHCEKGAEMADRILRRLKYDNDTRKRTVRLVRYHDELLPDDDVGLRHLICRFGKEDFPLLLEVKRADICGKAPAIIPERLEELERTRQRYLSILAAGDCLGLKELAVSGNDLTAAGLRQGRQIGEILERMLEDVLTDPGHNDREYLLEHYL